MRMLRATVTVKTSGDASKKACNRVNTAFYKALRAFDKAIKRIDPNCELDVVGLRITREK